MPWWGLDYQQHNLFADEKARWQLQIHPAPGQAVASWQDVSACHLFLLDLYSPGQHPEQWQDPLFPLLSQHAAPGAVLASYSCARSVRDGLARAGWDCQVHRRAGWRDTLVAHFLGSSEGGNG